MKLDGCVKRNVMMDLEEPHEYCMFISIGLLPLEMVSAVAHNKMMSADAHNMMMRVFMRRMTLGVPLTYGCRYRLA